MGDYTMTEINNQQNNQDTQETSNVEKTYIVNENPANNQQMNYQQPYVPKPDTSPTVSILDWVLTIIVMAIPCVNVIMLFVYAFTGDKESKKNFFKARLILIAASIIASVIFWVVLIIVLGPRIPQLLEDLDQLRRQYGF
jgi:cytochrome bd-type quinol oxidase subunit 1